MEVSEGGEEEGKGGKGGKRSEWVNGRGFSLIIGSPDIGGGQREARAGSWCTADGFAAWQHGGGSTRCVCRGRACGGPPEKGSLDSPQETPRRLRRLRPS